MAKNYIAKTINYINRSFNGWRSVARLFQTDNTLDRSLSHAEIYMYVDPVQTSINKISDNIGKAHLRFFDQQSNEIITGESINKFRNYSQLTEQLIYNWYVEGAMAVWSVPGSLPMALDIARLNYEPETATTPDQVRTWVYRLSSNEDRIRIPAEQVSYRRRYSPAHLIWGLSFLHSLKYESNAYYYASHYAKSFFDNNAMPSAVMSFDKPLTRDQQEQIRQELNTKYGAAAGQAHKTFVTSGGSVSMQKLSAGLDDIDLVKVQQFWADSIYGKFGVPPLVAGLSSKTRFDSAEEELRSFAENTLSSLIDILNPLLQSVLDRYNYIDTTRGISRHITKSARQQITKVLTNNTSPVVVIIDKDTLPAALQAKRQQLDAGTVLIEKYRMTPKQVSDYFDLELPVNDWSNTSFIPANMVDLQTHQLVAPQAVNVPNPPINPNDPTNPGDDNATKELAITLKKLIALHLRKQLLTSMASGKRVKLAELDSINSQYGNEKLRDIMRIIYGEISKLSSADDAKNWLNSMVKKNKLYELLNQELR